MATDLASRGLDIKGIETVVNYDMPGPSTALDELHVHSKKAGGCHPNSLISVKRYSYHTSLSINYHTP